MKKLPKKYPLLISLIISCVIVVASVFVLAFCGIKLSPSLGGGSQFEVAIPDKADQKTVIQNIKDILSDNGVTYDSFSVEDNGSLFENGEYASRRVLVNINKSNVSNELETKIRTQIAEKLDISVDSVSSIENIISSITTKDILLFGLGIGLIAIGLFIFGLFRYNVFAGLSFLLAILHNLILFLSIVILTRVPLSLVSVAGISVLSLVMIAVLVSFYEKNKIESEMHLAEKETPSSRLIRVEAQAVRPYFFVALAVVVFSVILVFVPVNNVLFSALTVLIALVVTAYSSLIIGPAVYGSFMDIAQANFDATLSRNDTVNKVIKKKIAKAKKQSK